jgi:hypothetical protein
MVVVYLHAQGGASAGKLCFAFARVAGWVDCSFLSGWVAANRMIMMMPTRTTRTTARTHSQVVMPACLVRLCSPAGCCIFYV